MKPSHCDNGIGDHCIKWNKQGTERLELSNLTRVESKKIALTEVRVEWWSQDAKKSQ